MKTRLFITQDHILREFFETMEKDPAGRKVAMQRFFTFASKLDLLCLHLLRWKKFVGVDAHGWGLTPKGTQYAKRLTRNHRLWEEFLIHYADLAASHVDRSADMVEHSLSPEVVRILENALLQKDEARKVLNAEVPGSVHSLDVAIPPEDKTRE